MSDAPRSTALGLPEPLTPADCDLQDFPFMPLHVARLRDSDLASEAHPEACWYAVLLWAASWHQLPAASLPDNDVVLARLCGLGRDVRTFAEHRAEALRGFVLCSDGRLYHPVVAEQARSAWDSKRQQRWRTECARLKKANQRDGGARPLPTYEQFIGTDVGRPEGQAAPGPAIVPEDGKECPSGRPEGKAVQETGTGTGILERETDVSLSPRGRASEGGTAGGSGDAAWRETQALYGELVVKGRGSPMHAKSAWLRLTEDERRALPAAIRAYAAAKPWGTSGAPGLSRFIGEDFWREFVPTASVTSIVWAGPADLRAAVAAEKGDLFVRSYLDPAEWRAADGERQAMIVPLNPIAAGKLRTCLALKAVAIQDPIQPRRRA